MLNKNYIFPALTFSSGIVFGFLIAQFWGQQSNYDDLRQELDALSKQQRNIEADMKSLALRPTSDAIVMPPSISRPSMPANNPPFATSMNFESDDDTGSDAALLRKNIATLNDPELKNSIIEEAEKHKLELRKRVEKMKEIISRQSKAEISVAEDEQKLLTILENIGLVSNDSIKDSAVVDCRETMCLTEFTHSDASIADRFLGFVISGFSPPFPRVLIDTLVKDDGRLSTTMILGRNGQKLPIVN